MRPRILAWFALLLLTACGDDDAGSTIDGSPAAACSPMCGAASFCEQPSCTGAGTCITKPTTCTRQFAPVCGCNNTTYGNDCMRQMAGFSKAYDGECLLRPDASP